MVDEGTDGSDWTEGIEVSDGIEASDGRPERPGRRGSARGELREEARRLLAEATFDDLTAFVTVRRLTERTGYSSGAVYSAFQPSPGVVGRSRSAPQSAARDALLDFDAATDEQTAFLDELVASGIEEFGADVPALLEWLATMAAAPMVASARAVDGDDGWWFTQYLLAAAVQPNDPQVAGKFRDELRNYDHQVEPPLAALLDFTKRELVDGVDLATFATLYNSVLDGCQFRLRLDEEADPSILATMYQALWIGLTRTTDSSDDRRGHRLAVPGWRPLGDDELEAVRAAVLRVTERAGWAAVTLAKVGQLAGVPDARLAGHYTSRHELSGIAWEAVVDGIERRDRARVGLGPADRLGTLVDDIVDAACSQRALVASLLVVRLQSTSLSAEDSQDPATVRAAALLEAALSAASTGIPPPSGAAAVGELHRRMSRTTLDLILSRAAMSEDSVETLTALTLDGISGFDIAIPDRGDP